MLPSRTASCPEGMVRCDGGKCIPESLMCDGEVDCADGADEPSTCGKKPVAWLYRGGGRVRFSDSGPSLSSGVRSARERWDSYVSHYPSGVGPGHVTSSPVGFGLLRVTTWHLSCKTLRVVLMVWL